MKAHTFTGFLSLVLLSSTGWPGPDRPTTSIRVSPRDPRYFEQSDGRPYVPIGLNMIAPPGPTFDGMAEWLERLSSNGGNFIRVWLGNPYFDVEPTRSGEYEAGKAERIEEMLTYAEAQGIRVKLCLEHFRHLGDGRQVWAAKPLHLVANGGTAASIADFFDGPGSRERFTKKLDWLAGRFGNRPEVFGWELWNEINAVQGGDFMAWTESMLPQLKQRFPANLCMQSLGSFDTDAVRSIYRRLAVMPGNDVAQVHRYLDLGARLEVCHGPVDVLAAEAVRELLATRPHRPVLLAESGAVEPRHTGPFKLYDRDTAGTILHDVLFAPFFAGAAGPGHIWHWDRYVAQNNLWWQFARFTEAVRDLDPPAEHFEPAMLSHGRLRVYALKGRRTALLWCRDSRNTWQSELAENKPPEILRHLRLTLTSLSLDAFPPEAETYDPWQDRWQPATIDGGTLILPLVQRSIVVRIPVGEAR